MTKASIRRHLNIPFAGIANAAMTMGIRTLYESGQVEFYMNNLQAEEESMLTGFPFATVRLTGPAVAGDTLTLTIAAATGVAGGTATYTVTAADVAAPNTIQVIANNATNAINAVNPGPFASGAALPTVAAAFAPPSFGQITFINAVPFTLTATATGGGGHLTAVLMQQGNTYPWPQFTNQNNDGTTTTYYGYVPICNFLESAIATASPNLALLQAGGLGAQAAAGFRPFEIAQRVDLYDWWRAKMGRMLSVSRDPWKFRTAGSGIEVVI